MNGFSRARGRRRGISEVTGTVLTIAITLIAGFAVFGYINAQAAVNEDQYGQAVAGSVNSLRESFVLVDMSFSYSGCPGGGTSCVNLWIYNNGGVTLQLRQISLYDSTKSQTYVTYADSPSGSGCGTAASPSTGSASYAQNGLPFSFGQSGNVIGSGSSPVELTLSLPAGCSLAGQGSNTTYYVTVLGLYGNVVSDYQQVPVA